MKSAIFRKVSLERLSSPEQLDQILRVTGSKSWVGLLALLVLSGVALAWAYEGSIPTAAMGKGMIVRTGGVLNVVSRGAGMVVSIQAGVGQRIRANQVIARIAQPELLEKIQTMREALAAAKHEQERALDLKKHEAQFQTEALNRQRANTTREMKELEEQARIAAEQIPVTEQLLAKGLVTKQSTLGARQKLTSVRGQIETLAAQLKQYDAQEFSQQSTLQQAANDMESRWLEMERNLASAEKELGLAETVVSPYAGEVIEVKVSPGGTVGQNTPILSIQPDLESLEVLVYLPSLQAKDARIGMEAQISPSTVRREEFGYMKGSITYVASYPATPAALMRNFQNEALVTSLTSAGPVTELRVALEKDPSAVSGFRWSSPNSPPVKISSGTLCDAEVVTQRQKPITLVIPLFKQKLGLG